MNDNIKLVSDFTDYYDHLFSGTGDCLTYTRKLSDCASKISDMKFLKSLGVPVIDIVPTSYADDDAKVVVYSDLTKHGSGKSIQIGGTAKSDYSHSFCSLFHPESSGVTVKYLQIGSLQLSLTFVNDDYMRTVSTGKLLEYRQLQSCFNSIIKLPIFSIDYINCNGVMTAIDFNQAENLKQLGVDRLVKPELVYSEVKKALEYYKIK